jgi:hypothetical protein
VPWSSDEFDHEVGAFLRSHAFARLLDIGAGAGKYGRLAREICPAAQLEAVEVVAEYVERFDLRSIYDRVYSIPVSTFLDEFVDYETDVCVAGDCIEHLRKSEGIDLVHFMTYRCAWMLIVFPKRYVQGSWEGHRSEAHRSVWSEADFASFECSYRRRGAFRMAVIRGYR